MVGQYIGGVSVLEISQELKHGVGITHSCLYELERDGVLRSYWRRGAVPRTRLYILR